MSSARDTADGLLVEIEGIQTCLRVAHREAEAALAQVRQRFAPTIARLQGELEALEVELERLVKSHKAEILAGQDRADLPHGSVMLKAERRVKRIRKMLANLKALQWTDYIKVDEAPDWDEIEKLGDEVLEQLGTKRVPKSIFSYEIKGGVMRTIGERYLGHVTTVAELREALRDLPDALPVEGHYGEDLRLDLITEIPEGGDPAAPLRPEPRRFVRVTY